jgi:hypothetical protein
MVVERGLDAVKGAKGPDEFLPPRRDLACRYIETFLDGVALLPGERARLTQLRQTTCNDGLQAASS